MTGLAAAPASDPVSAGLSWAAARLAAYHAGTAAMLDPVALPLGDCDCATLADDLRAGARTRLALVRRGHDGCGYPPSHTASAMLRGLARAAGFAVIAPHQAATAGDCVAFLPLPVSAEEHGPDPED